MRRGCSLWALWINAHAAAWARSGAAVDRADAHRMTGHDHQLRVGGLRRGPTTLHPGQGVRPSGACNRGNRSASPSGVVGQRQRPDHQSADRTPEWPARYGPRRRAAPPAADRGPRSPPPTAARGAAGAAVGQRRPGQLEHTVARRPRGALPDAASGTARRVTVSMLITGAPAGSVAHTLNVSAPIRVKLDSSTGGRGGMQTDPAKHKRQPRRLPHRPSPSARAQHRGQRMQRGIQQRRVDTIAGRRRCRRAAPPRAYTTPGRPGHHRYHATTETGRHSCNPLRPTAA